MGRPELLPVVLALNWHLARHGLLRVFLVVGERRERLVVSNSWRMRWLESFVMLDSRGSPGLRRPRGNVFILLQDLPMCVEGVSLFGSLGERFVLYHAVVILTLSLCEVLRPVVVVLDVGSCAGESDLLADLAALRWVGQDVAGWDHDFPRVLVVPEVLLDLYEVGHVLVG